MILRIKKNSEKINLKKEKNFFCFLEVLTKKDTQYVY